MVNSGKCGQRVAAETARREHTMATFLHCVERMANACSHRCCDDRHGRGQRSATR